MGVFSEISSVFRVYEVELTFEDRIMGGVPRDPKVIEGWLKSKAGITEKRELAQAVARTLVENGDDDGTRLAAIAHKFKDMDADELYESIEQASEGKAASQHLNGFKKDEEHGLYIEDRQIKALLKESTNILFAGERWGKTKKGPKSFLSERCFINGGYEYPSRIYLGQHEPSGIELVVGHVQDRAGKRSTLTYHEFCFRPTIAFWLHVVESDDLSLEKWADLWTHAEKNGLGALRSQSYGRFDVTKWQPVS